ncbi:hypothetical protein FN846DRAFT_887369 [Sphaerosporella brunnea]|uniref:Uncharacterized protein n=1 Tax=Sphaerosporella brunnea TaxID=1250544 RepID=A0A5J5F6G0_9PEZI|nr:hypothetical protein FN846DRAFT_887369 [Sphaerosporella brunnea]
MDGTCDYDWCGMRLPMANMARHMLGTHHNYFCHREKKYVLVQYENGKAVHLCTNNCRVILGMWKTEPGALARQARTRHYELEKHGNHDNWELDKQPVAPAGVRAVQHAVPPPPVGRSSWSCASQCPASSRRPRSWSCHSMCPPAAPGSWSCSSQCPGSSRYAAPRPGQHTFREGNEWRFRKLQLCVGGTYRP